MHFRSLIAVSVAVAALGAASLSHAAPASAPKSTYVAPYGSGALFLLNGHGWGHGVGMGQWGAQGYALQGYGYRQILAAYYPGTTFAQTAVSKIRVLLADGAEQLAISSRHPIAVVDANGAKHTLRAGSTTFTPALKLELAGGSTKKLPPPLTLSPTAGATLTLGQAYRGKLIVDVVDGRLRAINVLQLQKYLDGVVPAEMPSTWLTDALDAQAVAARSFALASRRPGAPFDVYADGRSQAYLGVAAETPEGDAAVAATKRQVLTYGGKVADTVFSSSTGGWTQSAADAWGGAGAPYLVSVRDPYDGISPWHDWGPVTLTAKTLAQDFGLSGKVLDATVTRNSSRRVAELDLSTLAHGKQGTASVAGGSVAATLDLRSTWFSVGVLSLRPPQPNVAVPYGSTVTLTGVVRGVKDVVLEERPAGRPWSELQAVTPTPKTGAISVDVQPSLTTRYRLATSSDAAAYIRITLMPLVSIASASRTSVSGTVQPALPGAPLEVEQQLTPGSQAWTTVAGGAVGSGGRFSVATSLQPGTVRVVVAPGNGWAPGASASATVA